MSGRVQNVASLAQLFYVGKLVRCKIISITAKGAKKLVSLTINPNNVNKEISLPKSGMVSCSRIAMCSLFFFRSW